MTIDGDPVVEEPSMFERGMYLYLSYCVCYVKKISNYMLEEQVLEERYPDLNEGGDIRLEDSREDLWMDFAEDGEDKSNIHALRWYLSTKMKEELIPRYFWWPFCIRKGVTLFVLVCRVISLRKSRTTKLLHYVNFIINHLNNSRVEGFERDYMGIHT